MSTQPAPVPHTLYTEYSFLAYPFGKNSDKTDYFIRHEDYKGFISKLNNEQDKKDASFVLVPRLTEPNNKDLSVVSIQSIFRPNYYLMVNKDDRIVLEERNSNAFDPVAACFKMVNGLANNGWVSFESIMAKKENFFIRHSDQKLFNNFNDGSTGFHRDATFAICLGPLLPA